MITRTFPARALRVLAVLTASIALVLFSGFAVAPAAATYYPVPVDQSPPTITGAAVIGNTLTVSTGSWVGQPVLFYNYSWSSPKNSDLSTVASYTVRASDIGQVLTARVTVQDGNNHTAYAQVSTAAVTASDVVNKVAPKLVSAYVVGDTVTLKPGKFSSGSGALTYTYAWSRTDGTTTVALTDTSLTHVITKADLGDYFVVSVTAKSATQFGVATTKSPGVAVPKPPVSSDAGLTGANRGDVTGKASKGVATITDPSGANGDGVFVYGYSNARELGWFALDADKRFTVNFLALSPGEHKLAVMNQSGRFIGWISVTRPAEAASLSGTANPFIAGGAVVLIVGIVIVIVVTQRRRRAAVPRRH